jgi:hypothetical protein
MTQDKGPVVGICEHSNELLGSMKGGELLGWLGILSASQEELCSMQLRDPYITGY